MRITPGQIGCGILVLYVLSLLGGDPEGAERRQAEGDTKALVAESRAQERQSLRLSSVALRRFRQGCLPVLEIGTEQEVLFTDETVFVDRETNDPFPSGVVVCNSRGWTAQIGEGGKAKPGSIAAATPQDSNGNQIPDIVEAEEIFKSL